MGLSIGLCLASGVVALLSVLLSDAQFMAWGWRIGFLLSGLMVFVGLYIRLNVQESPEFAKVKRRNRPDGLAVRRHDAPLSGQRPEGHGRALHRRRVLQCLRRVRHLVADAERQCQP